MNAAQVRTLAAAEMFAGVSGGCGYEVSMASMNGTMPAGVLDSTIYAEVIRLRIASAEQACEKSAMAPRENRRRPAPEICPVCGEDVPRNALACPECGADHNSGWREDAESYDGIDLPEEFDYEEFARREFGEGLAKPAGISWVWWVTAIVVLGLTVLYLFLGR